MNDKRQEKWRKIHAGGKLRYILVRGGLFWGLGGSLLSFLFDFIFDYFGNDLADLQHILEHFPIHFLFRLTLWTLTGCVSFWLLWNKMEKEYLQNPGSE